MVKAFLILFFAFSNFSISAWAESANNSIQNSSEVIISKIEMGDFEGVARIMQEFEAITQKSEESLAEHQKLIQSMIVKINLKYGVSLTMADVCRAMREQIQLAHEIPFEMQNKLLKVVDLLEMPPSALAVVLNQEPSPKFEASTAMILWPWNWLGFHKNKRIKALPIAHAGTPKMEIELPEKMAAGFMCALAGALITIIPGGQAVGLTLIGTGLAITLDGMAEGERPFHTSDQDPFKPQ